MEPFVAVQPGAGSYCLIWAADAISDAPDTGPFGLLSEHGWTWWWRDAHATVGAWFWREALLLLVAASALVVAWRPRRRRASRPR